MAEVCRWTTQPAASLRWPDWMPKPDQSGFTIQPVDTRTISEMEVGTVIRAEFDTDEQEASCTLVLNQLQSAWLESFEQQLVRQGATWFLFPLWISGQIQYRRVRMKARPALQRVNALYSTYSLTLQVEDRELMSADMAEILLFYSPVEILDITQRLHTILHVQAPGVSLIPADFWPSPGAGAQHRRNRACGT